MKEWRWECLSAGWWKKNLAERIRSGHVQLASGTKREARLEGY